MRATALMLLFLASASPALAAEAREIAGQRQGDAIVYDAQGFDRVGLATPATVVEWQMRAWWSTLLVPQSAANFR